MLDYEKKLFEELIEELSEKYLEKIDEEITEWYEQSDSLKTIQDDETDEIDEKLFNADHFEMFTAIGALLKVKFDSHSKLYSSFH